MSDCTSTLISRRNLFRHAGLVGAAATIGALPLGRDLALAAQAAGVEAQWPAVTALLDKYVRARKVSGAIAALGWGDRPAQFIARGREGFDDKDPSRPESLYRAYSMTKPVTGMAAMMLIDEGKLGLDQPLADFAPEFGQMQVAIDPKVSLAARPAEKLITIRHLLTHTSGLGYAVVGRNKVAERLAQLGLNAGIVSKKRLPGFPVLPPTPDPDTFLKLAATVPLVAEPGTRWAYSMSLDVLGIVIGRVVGMPLDRFLAERLFGPAGMTSSFFQVPQSASPQLTTNYGFLGRWPITIDRPGSSIFQDPTPFAFGGSGLVTTPADYDRFLAMVLGKGVVGGQRVMSEKAVAMGTSSLLPEGVSLDGTWIAGNSMGAGGVSGKGRDEGLYGWAGAAGTAGYVQARLGLRSGIYTQYMPQEKYPILSEFPKALEADLTARAQRGAA